MFYSKRLKSWRKGRGKPEYQQPETRRLRRADAIRILGKVFVHGVCGGSWPTAAATCPTCGPVVDADDKRADNDDA